MMVDANAHTGANGDHRKDRAGKMLRRRAKKMHMTIINHTSMCKGKYSWMTERKNGTQSKTTIDYVMVSPSLVDPADGGDTWVRSQDAGT